MRQRALIAIAIAAKPELIIADEPTSALDVTVQRVILDHLQTLTQELGTAVLLVTHDLEVLAEVTRRAVAVYEGQILLDGEPREVFRQTELLARTFLKPPQITQLSAALGCDPLALSVDEMIGRVRSQLAR
jgi:peptide/nickel transport system ATP-binding protein